MQSFYKKPKGGLSKALFFCCAFFFAQIGNIFAEGTKQLSPTANDSLFLAMDDMDFGFFASLNGPEISRLNFKIIDAATEKLYIGLSPRVRGDDGEVILGGRYFFQIKDSLNNSLVHGPFEITADPNTFNIMDSGPLNNGWLQASSGPVQLNAMGYDTASMDDRWVFDPAVNGTYYIEFYSTNAMGDILTDNKINVPYFDFTVAQNVNTEQPGRVWSQNWALRSPQIGIGQSPPDCQWNREFNGVFFTYTADGFVSRVEFSNSGFQGLSFNVAFGVHGPGTSDNIVIDRQSIQGTNATANAAEHMAFLQEPDPLCFITPPNNCGTAEIVRVECINDSFCIFVTTTLPGQVEIILDFANGNGRYDPDTEDVILAQCFTTAPDTMCIGWDGLKGDGSDLDPDESIPTILRYTQGVQHYAAFDVEFLKNGFCVETVRPICPGLSTDQLFWDDSQISDALNTFFVDEGDPGTGQPKVNLSGDTCGINGTRTWTNFQTGDVPPPDPDCTGPALGYGELNTMNTWWFAAIIEIPSFELPVVDATIAGDSLICEGDSTQFFAMPDPAPGDPDVYVYNWSGPDMFASTADSTGMIGTAGEYCVTVTNSETNCSVVVCRDLTVNDNPTASSVINCIDMTQTANIDLTVSGGMGGFMFEWSGPGMFTSMMEDLEMVSPGIYTVIVTDANGCMAFDTVNFVECCDLEFTCPTMDGGVFTCVTDIPAADTTIITVTDFCDPLMIDTAIVDNGGAGCVLDTLFVTRTYTLSHGASNTGECVQVFTVVDDVNPTLIAGTCPNDTTVICNTSTSADVLGEPGFMDNCSGIITSMRTDSVGFDGLCLNDVIGNIQRTFFGADACGNVDSMCVQLITVIDSIAPTFTVPADTVIQCTVDTLPTTTGDVTDAADNCGDVMVTFMDMVAAGTCPTVDVITRTWTATDNCGNSFSAVQTITRVDTVGPVFTIPADTTIQCTASLDPSSTGMPTGSSDNCSSVTIISTDVQLEGNCDGEFTVTRTWTATDDCGNMTTGIQTITAIDTVAPTFTVPADIVIQCTQDSLPATTGMVTDTADNCSSLTLSFTDMVVAGSCMGEDTIQRTWTATDDCGNVLSQMQMITRIDTVSPVITSCPMDIVVDCTGSLDTTATGTPTATDNCSDVVITFTDSNPGGTCSTDSPVIRLFTATDGCGNTDTCSQEIVINDDENPTVMQGTCPMAVTIDCVEDPNNLQVTPPVFMDNCTDSLLIVITSEDDSTGFDGTCTNNIIGSILRTYYGTDICGNVDSTCTVVLSIRDTMPPTFTTPADTTIVCGQDTLPATTGDVVDAMDACQAVTVTFADVVTPGTCPAEDVTSRTWTVTDVCGNTATGLQIITRIDSVGPTFTLPADITIACTQDSLPATTGDVTDAMDNCGTATVTFADAVVPGDCPGELVITRTWSAEDDCGNVTMMDQTINMVDTVGPTFTVPSDTIINCESMTDIGTTGMVTDQADDCSTATIDFVDATDTDVICPVTAIITRTWTAVDECGNATTAVQSITQQDTTAPMVLTCPADITIDCDDPTTGLGDATYSDNCSAMVTVTSSDEDMFDMGSPIGTITRTFFGEDDCGNIDSSCVQIITVQDIVAPTFTFCPADTSLATCPPDADTMFTGVPLFVDNCYAVGDLLLTFEDDSMGITPECFQGTIQRTFTITDPAGNSNSSCVQNIMVNDTTGPVFDAPADTIIDCSVMIDDITISGTVTNVMDCSLPSDTSFTDVMGMMGCDGMGEVFRIWMVTDGCGNVGVDTQLIMVQDTFAPSLIVPADVIISCEQDPQDTSITGSMLNVSDMCGMDFMIAFTDDLSGLTGCSGTGTIVRTWFATDDCANVGSMSQTITVVDTTAPVPACQNISIDFDMANDIMPDPSLADNGSTDNCGDLSFALAPASFSCQQFETVDSLPAILTVTDDCGNTSTCAIQVLGSGGGGVSITCPTDILVQLGPGECDRVVNYEILTTPVCGGGDANVEQSDDSGLTSGDAFPIGTTVQSYIAFDDFGDTAMCSFNVIVIEYDGQFEPTCNDNLNISLDQNCQAILNGEILLEGEDFGCGMDFIIEVIGIGSDTGILVIDDPELGVIYEYSIFDPETGLSCWGTVIFEDKLPPVIECPCEDYEQIDSDEFTLLGTYQGHTYYVSTNTFSWTDAQSAAAGTSGHMLSVNSAGENQFIVDAFGGNDFRVHIGLTDDEAFGGMEAGSDPISGWVWTDGTPVTYTNWNAGEPNDAGAGEDYVEMLGSGQWNDNANTTFIQSFILEVDAICEYSCTDDLANLPLPTAIDGCDDNVELTFTENISGDECEGQIIQRFFTATDDSGNTATCSQTFVITPLNLDSLAFPENFEGECGDNIDPSITGYPALDGVEIEENLCNIFVTFHDKPFDDCGGGSKFRRTWTVLDWCTQEIVEGEQIIKLADNEGPVITCPADIEVNTDFWYCYANVSIPLPTAFDECGTPFDLTLTSNAGLIANFGNNYVINQLEVGTHTVTWIATDECGNSSDCSFLITVSDNVPPVPNCDAHTVISLTNDGPKGLTLVDATTFNDGSYDNCSEVTFLARRMDSCIDFDWTTDGAGIDDTPNGQVNSRDRGTVHRPMVPFACCDVRANSGSLTGGAAMMPIMVELEVTDASGNKNYCMVEVEVQDKLAPFIVCPPDIEVSCDFWFDTDIIQGQFVPLDFAPYKGLFGTVLDAYEFDESDRQPIIINDPGNQTKPQPFNWGIDGWADDNCNTDIRVRTRIIDDCTGDDLPNGAPDNAVRYIERTFRAMDNQGNVATCRQIIWVVDYKPFFITDQTCNNPNPNDGVIWPCDEEYTTCPDSVAVDYPTIFDDNCSQVGVTFKDTRFDFVDGACYKILREWTVIDWCLYVPPSQGGAGQGIWTYTQVIKVLDSDGPVFLDCPTDDEIVTLCVEDDNVSLPSMNQVFLGEENPQSLSCGVHVDLNHTIEEFCSETVTYDVKIYLFGDAGSQIQVLDPRTVSVIDGQAVLNFNTENSSLFFLRTTGLPYNTPCVNDAGGYHTVLFTVVDGCGNISTCKYKLRLEDCKQPTPVCINGISTVVMPSNGEVTLWAKEYNVSSIDDCTPSGELLYSFSGDSYQPSMTYTCDNVPAFDVEFSVQIWVADGGMDDNCNGQISWSERNKDFCTTTLVISDNDDVCNSSGSLVGGEVMTHDASIAVAQTNMTLTNSDGYLQEMVTEEDGLYHFDNVPLGVGYEIVPNRNDDHKNGVTTLDLVRIQKHLLGVQPFTSPYQFIAADANNSTTVSALDLVEIRKLILGIFTEYPNNQSWRFIPEGFEFADPMNPWPFNESIFIEAITSEEDLLGKDFMGVKVGDLNNTVVSNLTTDAIKTRGANPTMEIQATQREAKIGEEVRLSIEVPANALGFQWTMQLKGLQLIDIQSNDLSADHVAVFDEQVTMSYGRAIAGAPIAVELVFAAEKNGLLSEMIELTSDITDAEAYDEHEKIHDVAIVFDGQIDANAGLEFALYQNEPNPWTDQTVISFHLPIASQATISVSNAAGQKVMEIDGDYTAGRNHVTLRNTSKLAAGLYYYTLESDQYSATKKMFISN